VPGPLRGLRIIEIASVGPAPFASMMLADHGAEVIRVDRPGGVQAGLNGERSKEVLNRSRLAFAVDLKHADGVALVRALCRTADGLIEGFRPNVMERLGLGPVPLLAENKRLVYGRMTGWGQTGPYAQRAAHDINCIALSGNLHGYGRAGDKPTPPANAIGDFGGGGMLLAFGMLSAIMHAQRTGQGQVIDCAMIDGAALLAGMTWGLYAMGQWRDDRGVNPLDTGAPFYDTYATADGKYVSVGPIERQFYERFCVMMGLKDNPIFADQMDRSCWPEQRRILASLFKLRNRNEWTVLFESDDVCCTPVLAMAEAPAHPHNAARGTFVEVDGVMQPSPAPRYSATALDAPVMPTSHPREVTALLISAGYTSKQVESLKREGVIVC
jgi:alpha-methylacyl-CoA racemase